jgi:hypothetical protein
MKRSKNTTERPAPVFLNDLLKPEEFHGENLDFAAVFIGSGAPRLTAHFRPTAPVNRLIANGRTVSGTVRPGMKRGRLWVEMSVHN